jgi:tRNA-dihydrouridine synthase B
MVKIGNIELRDKPLFLAPMEDVTDITFRFMCKHFGADVMCSEFVSSEGLIRDARKTLQKLEMLDYERPMAIQIFGNNHDSMVEAAKIAESYGPDFVDINFGCPVKKVATKGSGAGMLRTPDLMVDITRSIVKALRLPVTVKTRLGWDEDSIIIEDLAEKLQDTGIAMLAIHGRTRSQFYRGISDWEPIGRIKRNPRIKIPIIGNGDIKSAQDAKNAFDTYGVDGIMIGRAVIGKPWIFKEVRHFLDTGELLPPLTVRERIEITRLHMAKSIERKGDVYGILEMRQHFSNYFKGLPNFKETRLKLVTTSEIGEIENLLEYIGRQWGDMPLQNDHLVDNCCKKLENL